jgi:hypothetical protein
MTFWTWILYGAITGLVITPIVMLIYGFFRGILVKRRIKRLIKSGQFLTPIDTRDYNTEAWKNYIDASKSPGELAYLNDRIFKKNVPHETALKDFMIKAREYVQANRLKGIADDKIAEELKSKDYTPDLINTLMVSTRLG